MAKIVSEYVTASKMVRFKELWAFPMTVVDTEWLALPLGNPLRPVRRIDGPEKTASKSLRFGCEIDALI